MEQQYPYKKTFWWAVYNQLYDYPTYNSLLYESQYRLCKYRSTELAAWKIIDRILTRNGYVVSCILHLSKAFDMLDSTILLTKLHRNGKQYIVLFQEGFFLSKRTQNDECHCSSSFIRGIESGVQQGPILVLRSMIYVNDIHSEW